MIERLRGVLVQRDAGGAVIECGGVGYGVAMSVGALARLGALQSEVVVLVHTHVAEDALRLFGFVDAAERAAFLTLLHTTGVGPRLALAILSTLSPAELAEAVRRGDKAMLTRIPGVGAKKAERLLVELRDRLGPAMAGSVAVVGGSVHADLASALTNLGFAPPVAERAAQQVLRAAPPHQQGPEHLPGLLRAALRAVSQTPRRSA